MSDTTNDAKQEPMDGAHARLIGEVELLDGALDAYFAHRYGPDRTLKQIAGKTLLEHDRWLANATLGVREALGYPQPDVIGESRCVSCHRVMGDESSADEEETVCRKCATPGEPEGDQK